MLDAGMKRRSFVLNPVTISAFILCALLATAAGVLWVLEISYVHPGPTVATILLAAVVLLIGVAGAEMGRLQTENNVLLRKVADLQAQSHDLSQQIDTLKAQNHHLLQEIDTLQTSTDRLPEHPDRLPRLIGLEYVVERWHTFEPKPSDSKILHEQFSIVWSIAQLAYSQIHEIRFIKYFSGFKIKGGAFLLQAGQDSPLVLKFDSVTNIEREINHYAHYVAQRLNMTPGEPRIPPQHYGVLEGEEWGAVTYNFIGADQTNLGRLQTFAEYYLTHDDANQMVYVFNKIFEALQPWWRNPTWPENGAHSRRHTLYGEYDRLIRRQHEMQKGIAEAGLAMQDTTLQNLTTNDREIQLNSTLRLRNPLHWIRDIFEPQQLANWIDQEGLRRDSIVHGDLHMGNILIDNDPHHRPRVWIIDFPHTHVGPTIQDLARLEADLKFSLLADETLQTLACDDLYDLETGLLPATHSLADLIPNETPTDPQLQKAWTAICLLRDEARNYMNGFDARPYYLALLHATLPTLYYRNRTPLQKRYALIAAALLCERLDG